MIDRDCLRELILEEGTRLYVYDDATGQPIRPGSMVVGHPTIGVGRCLDIQGITQDEALLLLDNNLLTIVAALSNYPWWTGLSVIRQFVCVSMAFNMGLTGLMSFARMIAALQAGNHEIAALEMLDSRWARQVPTRASRLAAMMRTDRLPVGMGMPRRRKGEPPFPTSPTLKSPSPP